MNRREFLKLGLTLAIGGLTMTANAAEILSARRIDFHAHAILPSYVDALKTLGIDAAIRAINEEFAELCRCFPKKFGFVATLPLPNVEGSIEEFFYATEKLGALGVKVASNSDGVYLGDEWLDPIFAALNEKNSLVIIHPSPAKLLPRENVITGKVMALYEYPADTTRAVLNLLANGTLEKFPRLKVIVPHCGSFLPYMKQRAGAMFQMLAAINLMEPVNFSASVGKLFFDTDYPYVPAQVILRKKIFFDEEMARRGWTDKIYVDNAKALLGG